MLPQIGLFQNNLINQIMSFYHSLMHIEYLYQVYKSQSTAYSTVVVEAELPEAIQQSQRNGEELGTSLQAMGLS